MLEAIRVRHFWGTEMAQRMRGGEGESNAGENGANSHSPKYMDKYLTVTPLGLFSLPIWQVFSLFQTKIAHKIACL